MSNSRTIFWLSAAVAALSACHVLMSYGGRSGETLPIRKAKSTNAEDIIHGPIKLAYERLLSEAFGDLSSNIDNDEDRKKINSITESIYIFRGNTNMIKDCKSIPNDIALKKKAAELDILDKSREVLIDNIFQFEMLCNIYKEKYGELKLVDDI